MATGLVQDIAEEYIADKPLHRNTRIRVGRYYHFSLTVEIMLHRANLQPGFGLSVD